MMEPPMIDFQVVKKIEPVMASNKNSIIPG